MKKFIYLLISLIVAFIISCIFFEIFLNVIAVIYRNISKSNNCSYVYILGESTSAGFPYGKLSYSNALKDILDNKIDDKEIVIVNLSYIGCQLYHQYIKYFIHKYLHPNQKGILLLYIGTNDWAVKEKFNDFYRFIFLKSNIIKLFDKYIELFIKRCFLSTFSLSDFQYEYEKIVKLGKLFDDEIYISTIAGNYSGFSPDDGRIDTESMILLNYSNLSSDKGVYFEEIKKIDDEFFCGHYDNVEKMCRKYLEDGNYPVKSQFLYRLGKVYEYTNSVSKANETYLKAIEYDVDDRPTFFQNDVIRKIAKKYNIRYVDFFNKIYNSGNIIGFNYFIDTIHPTIETNIKLAYEFANLISKDHNVEILPYSNFSLKNYEKKYDYDNSDVLRVYMGRIVELEFRNNYSFKYNKNLIESWIEKIKNLDIDENKNPNSYDRDIFLKLQEDFFKYYDSDSNLCNKAKLYLIKNFF